MIKEQLKEAKKACRFMQNVKPKVKNKNVQNVKLKRDVSHIKGG